MYKNLFLFYRLIDIYSTLLSLTQSQMEKAEKLCGSNLSDEERPNCLVN